MTAPRSGEVRDFFGALPDAKLTEAPRGTLKYRCPACPQWEGTLGQTWLSPIAEAL